MSTNASSAASQSTRKRRKRAQSAAPKKPDTAKPPAALEEAQKIAKGRLKDYTPEEAQQAILAQIPEPYRPLAKVYLELPRRVNRLETMMQQLITALERSAPKGSETPTGPAPTPGMGLDPSLIATLAKVFLGGEKKSDLDRLAEVVVKARTIADAINPPSPLDRIMPIVFVRMMSKMGFVTDKERRELERAYMGGEESST